MKKKQTKSTFYLLITVGLLLFLNSCQNLEIIEPENELEQMVSDAKYFFEKEVVSNSSIPNARNFGQVKTRKNIRKELQWDKAHIKELSFADALVIPVKFDEELYIPKGNSSLSISQLTYIIIYKDVKGKFNIEIVTTIPNEKYLTSADTTQLFSGLVLVEAWNGDFIKGFIHNDGEVENIGLIEEEGVSTNSRIMGTPTLPYCTVTDYYWCTDATAEGITITTCTLEYSITTCYGGGGGSSGGYDYPPEEDGGGSGGGDSNPSLDDNVCDEGYVEIEAGVCVRINLNMDDQGYKELTSCEKALLKANPAAGYTLQTNRDLAHTKTQEIFGVYNPQTGNGHNDCADAFRHAYFNALNALFWSDSYTKSWGDAHECDTPLDLALEKNMDLHNNAIGRSVAAQAPNISKEALVDLILIELEVGHLNFLSPLDSRNNIIPSVTQEVVATNCL